MKNRFVVMIPFCPMEAQNALTKFIQQRGWGFFHWGSDTWFLVTRGQEDALLVRESIRKIQILSQLQTVVVRVKPGDGRSWSLTGPFTWGNWFREEWDE
jgi:hypothetical protein